MDQCVCTAVTMHDRTGRLAAASRSNSSRSSPSLPLWEMKGNMACASLLPAMYREALGHMADVHVRLTWCSRCLDGLNSSAPQSRRLGAAYFDTIPLVSVRMLQLQSYAWALGGDSSATERFEALATRLRILMTRIDPSLYASRPPQVVGAMELALARHSPCKRSGRKRIGKQWQPWSMPDRTAALHMHLHLTHHSGTTLDGFMKRNLCHLKTCKGAAITNSLVEGQASSQMESLLLGLTANPNESASFNNFHPTICMGDTPIDAGFFEPNLPAGSPVRSEHIVWSAIIRHPAIFALYHAFEPNFALAHWLGTRVEQHNVCGAAHYCGLPSLKPHIPAVFLEAETRQPYFPLNASVGKHVRCCRPEERTRPSSTASRWDRNHLEQAKSLAQSFSILVIMEELTEGMLAFCHELGWSTCAITQHPLRSAGYGMPAMQQWGYGPEVFADLVDASQLDTELYFYARELTRAQHVRLGLQPPYSRVLPPGEFEGIIQ